MRFVDVQSQELFNLVNVQHFRPTGLLELEFLYFGSSTTTKTWQQLRLLARLFLTNELSWTLQPFSKLRLKEIYRCSSHLIDNTRSLAFFYSCLDFLFQFSLKSSNMFKRKLTCFILLFIFFTGNEQTINFRFYFSCLK